MFGLSSGTLETLVSESKSYQFAILVLTPDDVVVKRGETTMAARDNVLFELGLFMGKLGREHTFIVCSRGRSASIRSRRNHTCFYELRAQICRPTWVRFVPCWKLRWESFDAHRCFFAEMSDDLILNEIRTWLMKGDTSKPLVNVIRKKVKSKPTIPLFKN